MLRTVFVALTLAVQQPWVHLGSRSVSPGGERDIIRTVGEGRFKHISFTGNARSRVIALPGGARGIQWINFFYRRLPAGRPGNAIVHAYGHR